jgi:hypothetical protein
LELGQTAHPGYCPRHRRHSRVQRHILTRAGLASLRHIDPSTDSRAFSYPVSVVLQRRPNDCGVAAMCMLLRCWARATDPPSYGRILQTTKCNTFLDMCYTASSLGFNSRGYRLNYADLRFMRLPVVVHLRQWHHIGHFVVLADVHEDSVAIVDPAVGWRHLDRTTFAAKWTGYVLSVEPVDELHSEVLDDLDPPSGSLAIGSCEPTITESQGRSQKQWRLNPVVARPFLMRESRVTFAIFRPIRTAWSITRSCCTKARLAVRGVTTLR